MPEERRFVGKLVVLDRGRPVSDDGDIGYAVLIGGVLIADEPVVVDPSKAEMWEVEVTIRPVAKHRDYVCGNGSTMDYFLIGDYHDPTFWNEHDPQS